MHYLEVQIPTAKAPAGAGVVLALSDCGLECPAPGGTHLGVRQARGSCSPAPHLWQQLCCCGPARVLHPPLLAWKPLTIPEQGHHPQGVCTRVKDWAPRSLLVLVAKRQQPPPVSTTATAEGRQQAPNAVKSCLSFSSQKVWFWILTGHRSIKTEGAVFSPTLIFQSMAALPRKEKWHEKELDLGLGPPYCVFHSSICSVTEGLRWAMNSSICV